MSERGVDDYMLVGPMKRKVITTGIISAIIPIIVLGIVGFFVIRNFNSKIDTLKVESEVVKRYVLKNDVVANHIITEDDIELKGIKAVSDPYDSYTDGSSKRSEKQEATQKGMPAQRRALEVKFRNNENDDKDIIVGRMIKFNAKKNTILSESMFYAEDEAPTKDLRLQEFNMISLPSDLVENDYVDIRVRFPSGEDYSVIVGKKVEKVTNDTLFIKLTEDEILTAGSAIIEAYMLEGTKIYANKYVDPANQLFEYSKVDLVERYNKVVRELAEAKKEERIAEIIAEDPEANPEDLTTMVTVNVNELSVDEIAKAMGLSLTETTKIQEAIQGNDADALELYRNNVVTTRKLIARTYPVKENVLEIIMSNPNILEEVKANFNTQAILTKRLTMAKTDLSSMTEDEAKEAIEKVKQNLTTEIEIQKEERVAYLKSLLNNTSNGNNE